MKYNSKYLGDEIPKQFNIVSIQKDRTCSKYIYNTNFGVINNCLDNKNIELNLLGITKLRLTKDVIIGDTIFEYRLLKLVKKRRSCRYKKILIALENGKIGDIIETRFVEWIK